MILLVRFPGDRFKQYFLDALIEQLRIVTWADCSVGVKF